MFGRVVGALTRAWSHSVGDTNKVNATLTVLMELDSMGMPKTLAQQAIKRMAYIFFIRDFMFSVVLWGLIELAFALL